MSKFSRKHYEQVAQVLNQNYFPIPLTEWSKGNNSAIDMIVTDLIPLFKRDNPSFDAGKFRAKVQGG